MPTHDTDGNEYLKLADAKPGQIVWLDDGFTCAKQGSVELLLGPTGAKCFRCAQGFHDISGQCDHGEHCVGIYGHKPQRARS